MNLSSEAISFTYFFKTLSLKSLIFQGFRACRELFLLSLVFAIESQAGGHLSGVVDSFPPLQVHCRILDCPDSLKTWSLEALRSLKRVSSREEDPLSGQILKSEGFLLSQFVERALEELSPEMRARVDLIVLRNTHGDSAQIPRAFISKYPVMIAINRALKLHSVVPWTSKSKVLKEDLPLRSYFVSDLSQIDFTNYQEKYSTFFLKRRTDPLAMRGEKVFVQNCVSCHKHTPSPMDSIRLFDTKLVQSLGGANHLAFQGKQRLSDQIRRSIGLYFDAYRFENFGVALEPKHTAQSQTAQ